MTINPAEFKCKWNELIMDWRCLHSKLEQLERLRSEDTPQPPHDYPYHWVILDPKSKEDKVKVTNSKNSPKFQIVEFWYKYYMRHTFGSCLIRCANMKWIRWALLKIQSGHDSIHRQTDRQTDKVKSVYPPFNFIEAEGIITRFNRRHNLQCHWS